MSRLLIERIEVAAKSLAAGSFLPWQALAADIQFWYEWFLENAPQDYMRGECPLNGAVAVTAANADAETLHVG